MPLVLLETGFGAESGAWLAVAQGVAQFTRVCYYDRAGLGDSDAPPSHPRSPSDLVDDVHKLLHSSAANTPCVYVGQSFGGLIARLYAHQFPEDVSGMVLVDSMHVDQFDTCGPLLPGPFPGEPPMLAGMRAFWSGGWRDPSQNKENIDMLACREASRGVESLGDIPLHVLTASTFTYPPRMPPQATQPIQAAWEELQVQFTRLSSHASHEVLPDSGHFVQTDKPQAVIEAVTRVVTAVRGGTGASAAC